MKGKPDIIRRGGRVPDLQFGRFESDTSFTEIQVHACIGIDGNCVHAVDMTHSFRQAFAPNHTNGTRT